METLEQIFVDLGLATPASRFGATTIITASLLQMIRPEFAFEAMGEGNTWPVARPFGSPSDKKDGGPTPTYFTWWSVSLAGGVLIGFFL